MNQKISIIGAGIMGTGIAQVASKHGFSVSLVDSSQDALERSHSSLNLVMNRMVEKGKIDIEESDAILSRVHWTSEIGSINDSKLVIEAVIENMEVINLIISIQVLQH